MHQLKKLKLVNVDHNNLIEVGDWIDGLKNLINFDGKSNKTGRLSNKLGSMLSLTRLSLPANQIKVRLYV